MSLFDKLFRRKPANKPATPANTLASKALNDLVNSISSPTVSTFDEIENAISANPKSALFRTSQEQFVNYQILDLVDYLYRKDPLSFVAFDLETTGLNRSTDEIVEIAAVRVSDGQITERFHQLINPGMPMPAQASAVNHITDDMLSGKPRIYEILPDFLSFVGSDILIAHNARFDSSFIAQACLLYRFKYPKEYFDSMLLSPYWPDLPDKKLSTFLQAAGIDYSDSHRALADAEALAQLMIVALNKEINLPIPEELKPAYSNEHFTGTVEKIDTKLAGKRFVLTGEIDGYERIEYEKMIMSHGGKVTLKISNATDFLVVGSFTGFPYNYVSSKVIYARKLIDEGGKIKIIHPADVMSMLEET